jgi:hypothetical protein
VPPSVTQSSPKRNFFIKFYFYFLRTRVFLAVSRFNRSNIFNFCFFFFSSSLYKRNYFLRSRSTSRIIIFAFVSFWRYMLINVLLLYSILRSISFSSRSLIIKRAFNAYITSSYVITFLIFRFWTSRIFCATSISCSRFSVCVSEYANAIDVFRNFSK